MGAHWLLTQAILRVAAASATTQVKAKNRRITTSLPEAWQESYRPTQLGDFRSADPFDQDIAITGVPAPARCMSGRPTPLCAGP